SRPARLAFVALTAAWGAVVGTMVMAAYLCLAQVVRCNVNEVFAAQHLQTYKNFLRLKVDEAGVTVHPIGLKKPCKKWRWPRQWERGESAVQPVEAPPRHCLIEEPFVVTRAPEPAGDAVRDARSSARPPTSS
ncbi:MAG TPA: hypothetical protein VEU29_07135, partial [Actinomycetota bacterium]|nr:hypothetical protein [Actinomycetota bacterium]